MGQPSGQMQLLFKQFCISLMLPSCFLSVVLVINSLQLKNCLEFHFDKYISSNLLRMLRPEVACIKNVGSFNDIINVVMTCMT